MKTYYLTSILLFLILIIGCRKDKDDGPIEPSPPIYTNGSGAIGSIGGTVTINDPASPLNGVKVIIPKGALASEKTIQITEAPESVNFPGDSTQQLIRFLPAGLTFLKPITIELPYIGNDTTKLGIFYYDPETESISEIEKSKIDLLKKTISGLTNHFSYYTAWDETVGMTFNMINTSANKIGVRLDVFGFGNNEIGFKYIPTTWFYQSLGQNDVWDILSNTGYSDVYSVFGISLMEDGLIWNSEVAFGRYAIQRVQQFSGGSFQVDLFKENESERFYDSGDLLTEDIGQGYKNMGRWISGEPLIFLFDDFEPDPNKKYFVKVWWVISSNRNGSSKFCPSYELNNKPDKQNINEMQSINMEDIDVDNNLVWDDFQVWGVSVPPVCDFVANNTVAFTGESIQFSDQSSNDPTNWSWNFGDGGTSTQKNPIHSYNQPGVYSVSLTVTNPFGTDTKIRENYIAVSMTSYIEVLVPNGGEEWSKGTEYEITWNDNLQENVSIKLLKNNNVELTIASAVQSNGNYSWTVPTTLTAGTNYKVRIESVNNSNINDQSAGNFSIVEQGNLIVTNPSSSTIWTMGQLVPIEWETGELGGTVKIEMYKANNKLATISPDAPNIGSYYDYTVQTTLQEGDDYRVKIIANINPDIYDYSDYFEIIEEGGSGDPPVAEFSATPISGEAPLTVNFIDNSTNEPSSWQWDFGDGGTSTQQNPTHIYNNEGTYTVQLTVDNVYGSDTEIKNNYITVSGGSEPDTFTDPRDGQIYTTVDIGDQTWFAENLNYETVDSWYYDDDPANGEIYGRLYTWEAGLNTCPNGWHLPSDDEWKTLEMFLGMSQSEADDFGLRGTDEGKKLKSTSGWDYGNGTDAVGFKALPGGSRSSDGSFSYLGCNGIFWSSTEYSNTYAWSRFLGCDNDQVYRSYQPNTGGFSVRCLKN